jgi:hypothetical protein
LLLAKSVLDPMHRYLLPYLIRVRFQSNPFDSSFTANILSNGLHVRYDPDFLKFEARPYGRLTSSDIFYYAISSHPPQLCIQK